MEGMSNKEQGMVNFEGPLQGMSNKEQGRNVEQGTRNGEF